MTQATSVRIPIPVSLGLSPEALATACEQIPYLHPGVGECRLAAEAIEICCEESLDQLEQLTGQIEALLEKTARSFSKARLQVLSQHPGQPTHAADPFAELVASRQAIEVQPGIFTFQGALLGVLRGLESFFREQALRNQATEQSHPTTLPVASMVRNGYLAGFPHHAYLVSEIHRDLSSMESVATLAGDPQDLAASLAARQAAPRQMLAPTVCHHCFESLRARSVLVEGERYTALQACHRNEGQNVETLARLNTYTMREIVFFGSKEFVEATRQQLLSQSRDWVEAWGLRCQVVTATDPFFAVAKESKRAFQTLMGLKYELQAQLPHADRWLSVASFNNHQTSLTGAYDIVLASGQPSHSGCVGFGYERLAYALYSQFGSQPSEWPAAIRRDLQLG